MSATDRKAAMGYKPAGVRSACRNCTHGHEEIADRMPPYDTRSWWCKKGDFTVTALAICTEYLSETAAAQAAKQGATTSAANQLSPDQAEPTQGR